MTENVAACIVTYNSERHLRPCLEALAAQTRQPRDVLVWDNASSDQSVVLAEKLGATVLRAPVNVGFARAANELIARTTMKYVLLLNPDAYLGPRYVEELEKAAEADPAVGREPMQNLARDGNLFAFPHSGFWHAMDSLRDKMVLEEMWAKGNAPWKIWDDAE